MALPCRLPFYGLLTPHASFPDFIASKSPPVRPVGMVCLLQPCLWSPTNFIGWPMKSPMRPFMLWIPNLRRFFDCHPDIATSMLNYLKRILSISLRSMSAMLYPTSTFFTRFTFCQTLYVTRRPRCISRTKMPPMPSTANLHPKHRSSHGVCMNQQFLATNDSAGPERRRHVDDVRLVYLLKDAQNWDKLHDIEGKLSHGLNTEHTYITYISLGLKCWWHCVVVLRRQAQQIDKVRITSSYVITWWRFRYSFLDARNCADDTFFTAVKPSWRPGDSWAPSAVHAPPFYFKRQDGSRVQICCNK